MGVYIKASSRVNKITKALEVGVEVVVERHEKGPNDSQADKKENEPQGSLKLKGKNESIA